MSLKDFEFESVTTAKDHWVWWTCKKCGTVSPSFEFHHEANNTANDHVCPVLRVTITVPMERWAEVMNNPLPWIESVEDVRRFGGTAKFDTKVQACYSD